MGATDEPDEFTAARRRKEVVPQAVEPPAPAPDEPTARSMLADESRVSAARLARMAELESERNTWRDRALAAEARLEEVDRG